ncbi:universal stress protein [Halomonas cibimaris]|uniref:Universal stress protein n=1 Tax=Halomonas cibimaris TaxID=657012 RepID=A0ABP7LQ40_9GAMM
MYRKILLPVDLDEEASWHKALPTAVALCRTFNASLHVLTVRPGAKMPMVSAYLPKNFSRDAEAAVVDAQRTFIDEQVPDDIQAQSIVVGGSPWEAIIKVAEQLEVELIVMASHTKRRFVDYVLGPNSEHVVHHTRISVMIVR